MDKTVSTQYYLDLIKNISHDCKYTTWYINICLNAKTKKTTMGEKHHILPKCLKLGGDKDIDNLVILTYKEHYVCHRLLTKMLKNKKHQIKMSQSFTFFSFGRTLTSRQHEVAKRHRKVSDENRNKNISLARKNTTKLTCQYCGLDSDPGNFTQFHGEKCRKNPNISSYELHLRSKRARNGTSPPLNKHILHGVETKCPHCGVVGYNVGNMHLHHFNNCKLNKNKVYKPKLKPYSCVFCRKQINHLLARFHLQCSYEESSPRSIEH